MELAQGCRNRNKRELDSIKKGLAMSQTEILPVNEEISIRAMQLIDIYTLSHECNGVMQSLQRPHWNMA